MDRFVSAWIATVALLLALGIAVTSAGDDASGPIRYSVDLSAPFSTYELTPEDRAWSASLVRNLGYTGEVVHFVRTTLELTVGDGTRGGSVYQAVEKPDSFYVVPGDVILQIGLRWPKSTGCGGFSMHAPRSRNFIVCLDCEAPCVPFLSGSPVVRGRVTWGGGDRTRF